MTVRRSRQEPTFGTELRRYRKLRNDMTLRALASKVNCDFGNLGKIERGDSRASRVLAEQCDQALNAHGSLIAAWIADTGTARPAQLPAAPGRFVGRAAQWSALERAIEQRLPGRPTVIAIDGQAGVGKTALALRWAHHVVARYPDGQLYADLRGFAPAGQPLVSQGKVLEWFCTALGASAIPDDVEERAALYRSLLARRRVLIVLDNAADAPQVEHLMPGAAGCTVVVTSRRVLSRLTIQFDAHRVTVRPLSEEDSTALVRVLIGAERADTERSAVAELVRLCGNLPLALRIGAERVAIHPNQSLTDLVTALSDDDQRLDSLQADEMTAVRTVFSWSYRNLQDDTARMFRLLGLHRGTRISCAAAAALADVATPHAQDQLRRLAAVNLVEMTSADVVDLHDLLRDYARELAHIEDDEGHRRAAVQRLSTWYLHTVHAAGRTLAPYRTERFDLVSPLGAQQPLNFDNDHAAMAWCDGELHNFVAVTRSAAEYGPTGVTWRLAVSLWDYLVLRRPWGVWVDTHELAQLSARLERDSNGEGWVTTNLAEAMRRQQRWRDSQHLYDYALRLRRESGDRPGHARTLVGAARLALDCAMVDTAQDFARRAHEVFLAVADRDGQAAALLTMADVSLAREQPASALADLRRAMRVATAKSPHTRGRIKTKIAKVHRAREDLTAALSALEEATGEFGQAGDRASEARARTDLGDVFHQVGRSDDARAEWAMAMTYYEAIRDQQSVAAIAARFGVGSSAAGPVSPTI